MHWSRHFAWDHDFTVFGNEGLLLEKPMEDTNIEVCNAYVQCAVLTYFLPSEGSSRELLVSLLLIPGQDTSGVIQNPSRNFF